MDMTGAQAMIKALENEGVKTVFGYPGAAVMPFYDALLDSRIRHVLTRCEQGAAHAASGYSRVTGQTGVCIATSGPGATNLITGIATAYMDSIPLIAITGQVALNLIGSDSFQEVDITGATSPFTKHNYLVKSAADLPRIIKEAFYLASTGRPGPVLIDVPVDVQSASIDELQPATINLPGYHLPAGEIETQFGEIATLLQTSKSVASQPAFCAEPLNALGFPS
jgi:acetolactate synthase-1/2/3 large subunit